MENDDVHPTQLGRLHEPTPRLKWIDNPISKEIRIQRYNSIVIHLQFINHPPYSIHHHINKTRTGIPTYKTHSQTTKNRSISINQLHISHPQPKASYVPLFKFSNKPGQIHRSLLRPPRIPIPPLGKEPPLLALLVPARPSIRHAGINTRPLLRVQVSE